MGFLQQTLLQVQEHLKGLSLSQKVAIGLCVGLIAVSLSWLMNWSVTPDLVPLLDQSFKPQELSAAQRELDRLNVAYVMSTDRVLVPADQRDWLLARLQESEALPSDMSLGFARLMEQQSIWLSNEDSQWRREIALGNELAGVLRRFTGVREARVFIDRPMKKAFGRQAGEPKASVYLQMRPNATVNRAFVDAVAGFVSGAVVGMKPQNVSIVDATTGQRFAVPNGDSAMAADLLEDRRKKEEHYTLKIQQHLAFIPGVLVGVFADIETESRRVEDRKVGQPMPVEEETSTTSERSGSGDGEPGVMANVAARVPGGSSATSRDESTERVRYERGSETVTVSENVPGNVKRLTASVNVPRSYFVNIFRQQAGNAVEQPSDQDLESIITAQLASIRQQVKPLIDATADDQVQVGWFYDPPAPDDVILAEAGTDFTAMFGDYARPAGLAGLAVLSLAMMVMLVRRAQPPPARVEVKVAGAAAAAGGAGGSVVAGSAGGARRVAEEVLAVEGGPVGKVQPTETVLSALEVDEQTLKSQRIIEQVNDLVRDDPDAVASMLRKWIEESH